MKKELLISESIKDDIISYLSNDLSSVQTQRLLDWVNENPDHKRFLDEITDVWQSASALGNHTEFDSRKAWNDVASAIEGKLIDNSITLKPRLFKTWLKIAAIFVFAFLLGGGSMLYFKKSESLPYAENYISMEAPLGSKSFITLPDGTRVWLNAGTKLRYKSDYGVKIREVLLDGEAYFVVAKNKQKPFIVKTSDIRIKALGTSFNVKAYHNENTIETTLEEGMVRIDAINSKNSNGDVSNPVILKPNQKAIFSKSKGETAVNSSSVHQQQPPAVLKQIPAEEIKALEVMPVTDIRTCTSWKDTRWVIRHEKLSNLVVKLERRYAVNFTFENEEIKEYVFNGTLLEESLEQVLEVIRMAAPIDYNINHKNVTLTWNKQFKDKYQNLLLQKK